MKRILAVILLAAVLAGLAGCGATEEKVVGVWTREPLYMAHYGCQTVMIISLASDGSFTAMLLDDETHNILNYAGGTWSLEGNTVVAKRTESLSGTNEDMRFQYNARKHVIEFEGYEFKKTE